MGNEQKNTWAVILGGSSGLGLASAESLAQAGFHVCIVHRDRKSDLPDFENRVSQMEQMGVRVKTFNKDIMKEETLADVMEFLPKRSVKVLVHSIAKGAVKPLYGVEDTLSMEDVKITLEAMALSWWQWTSAFIKNELFAEGSRNLAFTSEGNSRVWKGYGAVSIAKAALEALMRQMAVEYAPLGISTNCIQAGVTDTPSLRHIPEYSSLLEHAARRNPFSRVTTPDDIGKVVAMLCGEGTNWINGTVIKADGGESLC